ncbi:MAG: hypothetical protein LN588_04775 [Rickettsia endosymbiont of Bryobia graminum]|nr:hypothetical protein [Rickettsia endosymbiont of Bryobia graminum]
MFVKNLILLGFAALGQMSYGYRMSNNTVEKDESDNAVGINPQNTTMAPNLLWTLPREQGVR